MEAKSTVDLHEKTETGWMRRIFSQDHKVIGKQYMITAFVMAAIGGILSILMRMQLAWPGESWPLLGRIFPEGMPDGTMTPEFYLGLMTIHGTVMAIFVLTAVFTGGFGNYLIPLQIGARDMAFPLLNMLSYWIYLLSCITVILALFVQGGAPISGWTAYPPLSALPEAGPGQGLGQTVWILAIALFIVASLMGTLNYITTIFTMRTKGLNMMRLPLNIWGMLSSSIIGLLTFPVLLAAGVFLLFDRLGSSSFFVPGNLVVGDQLIAHSGGNPLLWQHLFWFFGHPEVYIVIVPAMGLVAEVLAANIRKPVFGFRIIIYCWISIVILSLIVWGHHMYVSGLNPYVGGVFAITTLLITVPSAVFLMCEVASLWRARIRVNVPMLFVLGFISIFAIGGLGGFFLGSAWTDIQLHDTYFVVGHFHLTMAMAPLFGMFAATYYWFPKMFGRMMNMTLGKIHFWFTLIGSYFVFLMMHSFGLTGMLRHNSDLTTYDFVQSILTANVTVSIVSIILASAQILFLFNFFWSLFKGKKEDGNPWEANTLEWTTQTPPPHGNWKGDLPEVHRWPYDYGLPNGEKDFIPQNVGSLATADPYGDIDDQ